MAMFAAPAWYAAAPYAAAGVAPDSPTTDKRIDDVGVEAE
jgi:hypothetical protein